MMSLEHLIEGFYREIRDSDFESLGSVASRYLDSEVKWCVAHPVNELVGSDELIEQFLKPLLSALPDIERKPFVMFADRTEVVDPNVEEGARNGWIAGTGLFLGTFASSLFGIPATGRALYLRYTEMIRFERGKIRECYLIPDFIDAMHQAGVNPLRVSLGHPGQIVPPTTQDGLQYAYSSAFDSLKSRRLVLDMLDCLGRYDGESLQSMDLENYWHQDFMWYGPGGIGATRGIEGFRKHHQGPFVRSFPDRSVDTKLSMVACGNYVATGGWPHMSATHSVGGWLGLPPTHRHLTLRVMDIWRREDELLKENWVAIDIIDMLMQMGLDVFGQMRELQP